jgi:hypothetical protein
VLVGTVAVYERTDSILVVALAHTAVRMGGGTHGSGESSPQQAVPSPTPLPTSALSAPNWASNGW